MEAELDKLDSALGDAAPAAVATMCGNLAEDAIDLIIDRHFQEAEPIYRKLQRMVDRFVARHGLEIENTESYLAGQVTGLTLVFGAIAARLPASFVEIALNTLQNPKYCKLLEALLGAERTTTELAAAISEDASTVSRKLTSLRHLGLVHSTGSGRLVHSRLTPAVTSIYREMLDRERVVDSVSPSEKASNVIVSWQETIARFAATSELGIRAA